MRVEISVPLAFRGRSEQFDATAAVSVEKDGSHHVEWLSLSSPSCASWPIDRTGLEGFDLSQFDEKAVREYEAILDVFPCGKCGTCIDCRYN
jgi:hypothetical protein